MIRPLDPVEVNGTQLHARVAIKNGGAFVFLLSASKGNVTFGARRSECRNTQ